MLLEYAAFRDFSVFMYERVNLDYDGIFGSIAAVMAYRCLIHFKSTGMESLWGCSNYFIHRRRRALR